MHKPDILPEHANFSVCESCSSATNEFSDLPNRIARPDSLRNGRSGALYKNCEEREGGCLDLAALYTCSKKLASGLVPRFLPGGSFSRTITWGKLLCIVDQVSLGRTVTGQYEPLGENGDPWHSALLGKDISNAE